jgi:hypothetical protein
LGPLLSLQPPRPAPLATPTRLLAIPSQPATLPCQPSTLLLLLMLLRSTPQNNVAPPHPLAGSYREAAAALQAATAGSAAQPAVEQWVAQARLRALADQALQLLQAHAGTVSTTLGPA